MEQTLQEILTTTLQAIESAGGSEELNQIRVRVLGRKGELTAILRELGKLDKEQRPVMGQKVNQVREQLTAALETREAAMAKLEQEARFAAEALDVSLPGQAVKRGRLHPLSIVRGEIRDIFIGMGFDVKEGPEVEYERYNFEMLNIPENHPARDMQDTFYVRDGIVLRTHTSPVQVRTMLSESLPIRMICPGRVYRSDDVDATHSPMFHQVEGLVVDRGICFSDLKGVLDEFIKKFYGSSTKTRFRPGYFPFTEPSAEVDATCAICHGKGCGVCKGTGWIEILGCGMVHPSILEGCGIDPEVYTGFAFGLGLDRLTTIKYGITDIRLLFEGDTRFLSQF